MKKGMQSTLTSGTVAGAAAMLIALGAGLIGGEGLAQTPGIEALATCSRLASLRMQRSWPRKCMVVAPDSFDQGGLPLDVGLDDGGVEVLDVVDVQHCVLVAFVGCHGYRPPGESGSTGVARPRAVGSSHARRTNVELDISR